MSVEIDLTFITKIGCNVIRTKCFRRCLSFVYFHKAFVFGKEIMLNIIRKKKLMQNFIVLLVLSSLLYTNYFL